MRYIVTYSLLAVLIAKVAAVLAIGPASIELDAQGYWELSELVMDGDLLLFGEPIAYRTPIYPWFLAAVRTVFGDHALIAVVSLQGVMAVGSVWLAGRIAEKITGSDWALPLTLVLAIPGLSAITYSATTLTDVLFTFLLMVHLSSVLCYQRSPSRINAWKIGTSFALTVLTRPVAMYLWIAHVFLLAWQARVTSPPTADRLVPNKDRLGHFGIVVMTIGLLLAPWLVRNRILFDTTFVTEFLGRNIWIVTFQDGSGAGLELPVTASAADLKQRIAEQGAADQWRSTWRVSRALVESGLSDAETDRLMKQVSMDAMKSAPGPVIYKTIRRTANFWRCAVTDLPAQGLESGNYQGQRYWTIAVTPIGWAIEHRLSRFVWFNTLLIVIIGIAVIILIIRPETRTYGIWVALILSYFAAVTGLVEIPNYRYRIVVEPLSAAVVASAIAILVLPGQSHPRQHVSPNLTTHG